MVRCARPSSPGLGGSHPDDGLGVTAGCAARRHSCLREQRLLALVRLNAALSATGRAASAEDAFGDLAMWSKTERATTPAAATEIEAAAGERLPPAKDLGAILGVNTNTVLRSLRLLRDEGLLESVSPL